MRAFKWLLWVGMLVAGTDAALAQQGRPGERWSFADTEFFQDYAWNLGRLTGSFSEIAVFCEGGQPFVLFDDGQVYQGDTRQGRLSISVDGRDFSRVAEFIPHGHVSFWKVDPGAGLLDALMAGSTVTVVSDNRGDAFSFSLRGSSAAISQAVRACGGQAVASAGGQGGGGELSPDLLAARIREVCRGPSTLEQGAIASGDIDRDGRADYLLDWSKVDCADRSVGRGGGFCGMQMCSVDVYASSVWTPSRYPQGILTVSYELAGPGDDFALQTTSSGGGCPFAQVCHAVWRWNGAELVPTVVDAPVESTASQPEPSPVPVPAPMAEAPPAAAPVQGEGIQYQGAGPDYGQQLAQAGIVPGQWSSLVPEGAMGAVFSLYVDLTGLSLTLGCAPTLPGLTVTAAAPMLTGLNPDFGPEDDVFLRLRGEDFRLPFHETLTTGGDPGRMTARWDGQVRLLALLNAGADVDVMIAPDGDYGAAIPVGRVPGSANNPGYAHVLAECGDGPTPAGAVQSFPNGEDMVFEGAWMLRPRTEHFLVPVSRSIDERNGMSFGLHCGVDGGPMGHLNPMLVTEGALYPVQLRIGEQLFSLPGFGEKGSVVFGLTDRFMAALDPGQPVIWLQNGRAENTFRTEGLPRAKAFALGDCTGGGNAGAGAPVTEGDDADATLVAAFEANGCVMTEAQLLEFYNGAGLGLMGANNAVIAVSERPDVEVISREPFTYRFFGSPYCGY
ncbi:hypothetical protein [Algicella marina]|uniref:Uncharacterized protein n=1 Tax=Algicella marina TaxID=2683284 RepID=A0A6P1SU27_9RHOB|nr:hypothetical protein [Algicella marina]QHQ34204.1 hypothetical protein GO499_02865 [Algicella marina]